MTLTDRHNQPIPRAMWRQLFANQAYRTVARDVRGGWLVETSWLGWCHDFEANSPKLFLTETKPDKDAAGSDRHAVCVWAATEAEAEAFALHRKALATLRGAKRP